MTRHGNVVLLIRPFIMGLKGFLPIFISYFLSGRGFKTRYQFKLFSHSLKQVSPRGGILSATLFSIMTNSISNVLIDNFEDSLYVDTCSFLVCYPVKNMKIIARLLQICLRKLLCRISLDYLAQNYWYGFFCKRKLHSDFDRISLLKYLTNHIFVCLAYISGNNFLAQEKSHLQKI